ncbi:molybdopterin-binding protein [Acidianus manzaensis]|uniref:Molybdopterin-binding protein n=1 Tax=Acidianus manzaensis TaxID=282676 RepID=A0A1W6JYL7_9CREN|nr:molybdopterin-binding protein [Acidianus manzaensis]ARM75310.1 molybdopterin-binding protein [Acidianus manzaensis]
MRYISVKEAINKKLGYDTTIVTPNGATTLLPRGHIITADDIPRLMDSGVYYIWIDEGENEKGLMYEWEITPYVASKICGDNVQIMPGKQGITLLYSKLPGILYLDTDNMINFNMNQKILLITKNKFEAFGTNELIGSVEVIPFSMTKEEVESIALNKKLIDVIPFKYKKLGVVITGTEIYEGRKKDAYLPVIEEKAKKYGWEIVSSEIVPDDEDKITKAILSSKDKGAEGIIVTGGTSVDPTDKTIKGITKAGAKIISYGIPMKPTTMTIVAIKDSTPIFGVSAGGIYYRDYNSIDKLFTRLMAGIIPTPKDIAEIGIGGISWNFNPKMKLISGSNENR